MKSKAKHVNEGSAKQSSGVAAERRKPLEIEECGLLPKAAALI
jgi:hypothetical protein